MPKMLTLITLFFTALTPVAFASETNINIHASSIRITLPQQTDGTPCLELSSGTDALMQDLEVVAGPGLDSSQDNQFGYLYRLIPETKLGLRFRGLQLPERTNTVEIRSKTGESLAELMDKHLQSDEILNLRLVSHCE
jgi:hypothetical protein